jgi:hypothetical protein
MMSFLLLLLIQAGRRTVFAELDRSELLLDLDILGLDLQLVDFVSVTAD